MVGQGRFVVIGAAVLAVLIGSGCTSFGSRRVPIDRFDYNEAIARSTDEQMLLNLVRLRYSEVPQFLAVNSVLTQYIYAGSVGVSGTSGEFTGFPDWRVGGNAAIRYVERPTVTYTPLTGQEFAAQLITPVRSDMVFSLVQSGWPPEQLLIMCMQRLNNVRNISLHFPDALTTHTSGAFQRSMELVIELATRQGLEMQETQENGVDVRILVFAEDPDPETAALIRELKDIIGLEQDRSAFRETDRVVGRGPDEITIRIRSILDIMGVLSQGVDVPEAHLEQNRARRLLREATEEGETPQVPIHVLTQADPPREAFVAVEFQGYWFYIPHSDQESKLSFGSAELSLPDAGASDPGRGPADHGANGLNVNAIPGGLSGRAHAVRPGPAAGGPAAHR